MKSQVIGRDPELAALTRALDRPGGTILLRSQAGIGKEAVRSPYPVETPKHTCYARYVLSCARYLSGDITGAIAVADRDADRLESMGAVLFAAQARLETAERNGDSGAAVRALEVFERAGGRPLDQPCSSARPVVGRTDPWRPRGRAFVHTGDRRGPAARRRPVQCGRRRPAVAEPADRGDPSAQQLREARLGSRVALARWGAENLA